MATVRPILLAEDNPNDVELTVSALQSLNLSNAIDIVHDGAAVLDYLRRRNAFATRPEVSPAVVLLDLKMPRVDGLETLRQIRDDPALRTTPVVILTSSREESDMARSYALRANGYVVKPVDFDEFTTLIRQLGTFWAFVNEPPPPTATG